MSDSSEKTLYKWKTEEIHIEREDIHQQNDGIEALLPPEEENIARDVNDLEEERVALAQQMPPKLSFSDHAQMLLNKEYTFMSGDKEKKASRRTKSSGYMRDVTNTLIRLEELLSQPAVFGQPPEEQLEKAFLDVCRACETYLKNRNPWTSEGKARKQMVKDFYKQVSWESMRFSELVREQKDSGTILDANTTWIRFLADARTETYQHGENGVIVKTGGEGTSDLHILEKDGVKKYFKESETLPPPDIDYLFQRELDKIPPEVNGNPNPKAELLKRVWDLLKARDKNILAQEGHTQIKSDEDYSKAVRNNTRLLTAETFTYLFSSPGSITVFLRKEFPGFQNDFMKLYEPYSDAISASILLEKKLKDLKKDIETARAAVAKDPKEDNAKKLANAEEDLKNSEEELKKLQNKIDSLDYTFLQNALWEIRKAMVLHELSVAKAGIGEGQDISKRNTATSRLANLLGLSDLVVHSKMTDITVNGKQMRGILMDEAKGMNIEDLNKEASHIQYSPDALKQILSLQVLDVICGQVDRHDKNFLCKYITLNQDTESVEITNITAIDNDIAFGQLTYDEIVRSRSVNMLKSIETNGELSIPAMDKDLAEKILALTPEMIHYQMCDILNEQERNALINRVTGVQKVIKKRLAWEKKQEKKNILFTSKFLSGNEWQTFKDNLVNNYKNNNNNGELSTNHTYIPEQGLM